MKIESADCELIAGALYDALENLDALCSGDGAINNTAMVIRSRLRFLADRFHKAARRRRPGEF